MDLPADAITYVMDDPARAVSLAAGFGGYFLSPEEIAQLLPHYPGFGANLTGSSVLSGAVLTGISG